MSRKQDLWALYRRAAQLPFGAGQIAAVEQLIRQVDAQGDAELAFAARMLGTSAYVYGGEPVKSFVTFSWCLADFDRNPQPHHQHQVADLLWHFKAMVNALLSFPEVPLDRTYAVLDDMERRYREGGYSLQAVYKYRHLVARHRGVDSETEEWYRRWTTTPRDELSDCAGCDPSDQVRHLGTTGRAEAAVALAEPVLAGQLACSEQPQDILTSLLLPYLRTGRRELAREAHRRAYRRLRGNLADLSSIGEHAEFCALTGNEARGLEIVERHLDWLDRAPSPGAAMGFAAAAALVLGRLDRTGHGELTVHRRGYLDRAAAEVPVGVLAGELGRFAMDLAARFDARNGTPAQSERIARTLAAEPIGEHLPLSASARRRRAVTGMSPTAPAPGTADAPAPAFPAQPPVPGPGPADVPADATPTELLELADLHWRTERYDHLRAVLRMFDERFADQVLAPSDEARWVELQAIGRVIAEDRPGAVAANRRAISLYQALPDPLRERVVVGRLGVLLCQTGAETEGLPLIEAAAAYLAEHGDPAQRATGYDRLALALAGLQRWVDALDAVERAAQAAEGVDDPYLIARLGLRRAICLQALERHPEARAVAAQARDRYRVLGVPDHLAAACICLARSLDDPAETVRALDEALPVATGEAALHARIGRARALLAVERPADAVDDFVEAVAICAERGVVDGSAFLRFELATAYRQAGRMLDAAEVAEEAVLELDRLGHQGDADRCRHLLAGVYRELGEDQPALALLDQLADNLDGPDNLGGRAQVLEEAGDLLYAQDRDGLAAQRFAAAAGDYRLARLPLDESRARRREADALHWAGEPVAALAAIERADAVLAALPTGVADEPATDWERSMLADCAARVLIGADRPEEALRRLVGVPLRLRSIEAFGEALQVELLIGEVLLRLDRAAEAEAVLRKVLGALPTGSGAVRRTAWLLAEALGQLGRAAEAEAVRREHDLDVDG
jgi:tetratricopeptide (TPR) repeat protein